MSAGFFSYSAKLAFRSVTLGLLGLVASGCGQIGPLYLPEEGTSSQNESQVESVRPEQTPQQDNDTTDANPADANPSDTKEEDSSP